MNLSRLLAPAAAVVMLASAGVALAHARLESSTPAADSTVDSLSTLRLTFSERVVPAFSTFEVENAGGDIVAVRTSVSDDGRTITGAAARPLPPGQYRVTWRIASADGHRMTGSYGFRVR